MKQDLLRQLPSIDDVLSLDGVAALAERHDREVVADSARAVVAEVRSEIVAGGDAAALAEIGGRVVEHVERRFAASMRHAVNAAGIILHTGLGRAMMPEAAIEAVNDNIKGYCTLATDLEKGQRATRDRHYAHLLCELTGAEAATVVNNNAAATLLVLNTLAAGKEVIVSRGQLVEIGGSFRMPDVMTASGAILREVGTTNKTHLRDYADAISENTGAILRVHMSNYRIVGFFEEPSIQGLTKLAKERGLPVIDDLGSGALVDLAEYGLESEPMVRESVEAGSAVACFSGDKLIGGPQSGIIVGTQEWIAKIKKNPLARALRIDKMTVAALEATLKLFLDRSTLNERHPTYRMLSAPLDGLQARAQAMAGVLAGLDADVEVVEGSSQVGSGSVPAEMMPTRLLSVRPKGMSADALARRLRAFDTPVFTRIQQDAVLFDARTVQPWEDEIVVRAVRELLAM